MAAVLKYLKGETSWVRYYLQRDKVFVKLLVANKPFGIAFGISMYFLCFSVLEVKIYLPFKMF